MLTKAPNHNRNSRNPHLAWESRNCALFATEQESILSVWSEENLKPQLKRFKIVVRISMRQYVIMQRTTRKDYVARNSEDDISKKRKCKSARKQKSAIGAKLKRPVRGQPLPNKKRDAELRKKMLVEGQLRRSSVEGQQQRRLVEEQPQRSKCDVNEKRKKLKSDMPSNKQPGKSNSKQRNNEGELLNNMPLQNVDVVMKQCEKNKSGLLLPLVHIRRNNRTNIITNSSSVTRAIHSNSGSISSTIINSSSNIVRLHSSPTRRRHDTRLHRLKHSSNRGSIPEQIINMPKWLVSRAMMDKPPLRKSSTVF
mmetsp:Transcript_9823/g.24478  ORF Transcript_9823/g.24478 Transcript_9823/m.24478 type:complete len:310 (+) Transcript_9823:2423-3352(+)